MYNLFNHTACNLLKESLCMFLQGLLFFCNFINKNSMFALNFTNIRSIIN
nr:MAG TPA: hypothetical protein [Caudoviricetes sp.]